MSNSTGKLNILIGGNAENFYSAIGGVQKKLQSVSKDLDRISKDISTKVSLPLTLMGGIAANTFTTFEDSMLRVKSLTGATDDQFKSLNDTAKQLGATTRFSASQVGDAMGYMALAGWNTTKILGGIDGVLQLAAASGEDLAKVSDILTDGLSAFGKEAEYSAKMADILAMTSAKSNTTVGMLGEAFKYVAPLAGTFGFEVEDVNLALGLMANAGIKGSQSGTALRTTISRIIKPTAESAKALNELGFSAINADGSIKPLANIMEELRGKFTELTPAQQAQMAGSIAGQEAMSGFLAIINASDNDFNNLKNNLYNAEGQAKTMAETLEGGLGGAFRKIKSNIESLLIIIGENLAPILIKVGDVVGKVTTLINNLNPNIQRIAVYIGVVLAVIPPLIVAFGSIIKIITSSIASIKVLLPLLGGISAPVLAIAVAVGAAVYLIIKYWDDLKAYFTSGGGKSLTDSLVSLWTKTINTIKDLTGNIISELKIIWNQYGKDIIDVIKSITNIVTTQLNNIIQIIGLAVRGITTFFSFIIKLIKGDFKSAFSQVGNYIIDLFKTISKTVLDSFISILNVAGTVADKLGFETIAKGIDTAIDRLDLFQNKYSNLGSNTINRPSEDLIFGAVNRGEEDQVKILNNNTGGLGNSIKKNIIEPIRSVSKEFNIMGSFGENSLTNIGKKIEDLNIQLNTNKENVSLSFGQYMEFFKQFHTGLFIAMEGIMQIGDGIQRMFTNLFTTGKLSFDGLFDSVKRFIGQLVGAIVAAAILSTIIKGILPGLGAKDAFSFGSLAKQFSGGLLNLGGRASGGAVNFGNAYTVGEHGSELFIPSSDGTILNKNMINNINNGGISGDVTFRIRKDELIGILKKDEQFKGRF